MGRRASGEGTIYRRADGLWSAQLSLPGGKRKTFYGKTQKDVRDKLLAARRDAQEGLVTTGPSQNVADFCRRWLEDVVKPSVRPRTYENYALNVRRLTPYLGPRKLATLRPEDVQAAYRSLLDKDGLSARSVQQAHAVLHRALHQALLWGLVGRNVAEAVTPPRPVRREMRTLTQQQVSALFTATRDHHLHALWVVLATTGLRVGEALGLRWVDVEAAGGRLLISRAMQRQQGRGLVLVEPKTGRSRRAVHVSGLVVKALEEHQRRQEGERSAAGAEWHDNGLVFCKADGRPLDSGMVSWTLHQALDRAGLPRVRVHDLRHTAATLLLGHGVHPKVVQELLGHSSITLTLDTYSHVLPGLHAEAAARMSPITENQPAAIG
jgi:integrase